AHRLLPPVAELHREVERPPVMGERPLGISEVAPGAAEVVERDELSPAVAGCAAQRERLLEEGPGALRLPQVGVGEADVVGERRLRGAGAQRRQDPAHPAVDAQGLLPLAQGAVDDGYVEQALRFAAAVAELAA